jgi:hypothetical protein
MLILGLMKHFRKENPESLFFFKNTYIQSKKKVFFGSIFSCALLGVHGMGVQSA